MTSIDLLGPASAPGSTTVRPSEYRTFGINDSWFKDCSDPLVDDGTEYQAAFFNALLAQVRSVIRGNGQTAAAADIVPQNNAADDLIWQACQHLYQRAQPAYALDTGVANSIVVALTPSPAELKAGMRIRVKIAADNTGATAIAVNTLNRVVKTVSGADLQKGMLVAGQIAEFVYDGVNWQLVSVSSEKFVFTPRARINTAPINSMSNGVWATHNVSLASSSNLTPVVGASSFTLPAGTYMFLIYGSVRTANVINATQIAQQRRLLSSTFGQIAGSFEASYLLAAQDLTCYHNIAAVATIAPTDVLSIQSYTGTTNPGDFNGGQAEQGITGTVDIVRIGN